jgi:hypothetical protein
VGQCKLSLYSFLADFLPFNPQSVPMSHQVDDRGLPECNKESLTCLESYMHIKDFFVNFMKKGVGAA